MEQKVFKVTFYKRPNGDEPMTDHLDSLDIKMRVKVLRRCRESYYRHKEKGL